MSKSIAVLALICALGFIPADKERTYTVVIPARLAQPLFTLISGGSIDDLTVGQAKDLAKVVNGQLLEQSDKFHIEDSLAELKAKKAAADTTKKK